MSNVRKYVENLRIGEGEHIRQNCPKCGGKNSFSASKAMGVLRWHCFRASCSGSSGYLEGPQSAEDMRVSLQKQTSLEINSLTLPDYFASVFNHPEAVQYLERNNCLDAVVKKLAEVYYDPAMDRVVFCVYKDGVLVDAVGRGLSKRSQPKWYRYGKNKVPFICGTSDIVTVVEDCASACAVSSVCTGLALLSTNLTDEAKEVASKYKKIILALDKDATRKSITMQRELSYLATTVIVMLSHDLKYDTPDEIRKVLNV